MDNLLLGQRTSSRPVRSYNVFRQEGNIFSGIFRQDGGKGDARGRDWDPNMSDAEATLDCDDKLELEFER